MNMSDFEMSRDNCVRIISGMKKMPDSPAHFSVYCCKDSNICVKMKGEKFIVYYNVKAEYEKHDVLLPFVFENELTFKIIE